MARRTVSVVLLLLAIACFGAVQRDKLTGKFIDVQKKTRQKVDMYLVNTPVMSEVPYFEVSVEFGDADYLAEYTPRHTAEELPEAWKPGEGVKGRIDKHHLYLERPDGTEIVFIIDKRTPLGKEHPQ